VNLYRLLALLPAIGILLSISASAAEGDFVLEQAGLQLVFDHASNYGLKAMIHKKSGTDLISAKEAAPTIFRLDTLAAEGLRKLTQTDAAEVKPTLAPDGMTLTLDYSNIGDLRLRATVTIQRDPKQAGFIWHIEAVSDDPSVSLKNVLFPFFSGCAGLGETPDDDVFVAPVLYGELHQNPYKEVFATKAKTLPKPGYYYPGGLAMQFTALYDPNAGFYLASEDPNANIKALLFQADRTTKGAATLSFSHHFPEQESRRFANDFPIRLAAFEGDWYDAADIYRKWAVEQQWAETTLDQRGDYPGWFKEPIPVFDYRNYARQPGWEYLSPEEAELFARTFIAQTRHPYVLFAPGWERFGPWAGPEFFPPRHGEESLAKMISNLHERSNRFMHMFCVSIWAHPRGEETEAYLKHGAPNRLFRPDGQEYNVDKTLGFLGKTHRMCPATEGWQAMVQKTTEECARRQFDLYQLDLFPITNPVPCYGKDHPHPEGWGRWWGEAWKELSRRALAAGRKIKPDMVFSAEEMCEIYIPYFDTYLTREERSGKARSDEKARLNVTGHAPIFQYVYHDYITGIGDFAEPTSLGDPRAPIAVAKQFTRAKHIGVRIPTKGEALTEATHSHRKFTLDAVNTLYELGGKRTLFARMIRPPKAQIILENGTRPVDWRTASPAIGAFESSDGEITVLLSNSGESRVQVRMEIPRSGYQPSLLVINGDQEEPSEVMAQGSDGRYTLRIPGRASIGIVYTAASLGPS